LTEPVFKNVVFKAFFGDKNNKNRNNMPFRPILVPFHDFQAIFSIMLRFPILAILPFLAIFVIFFAQLGNLRKGGGFPPNSHLLRPML
jgi:hypothetical protein